MAAAEVAAFGHELAIADRSSLEHACPLVIAMESPSFVSRPRQEDAAAAVESAAPSVDKDATQSAVRKRWQRWQELMRRARQEDAQAAAAAAESTVPNVYEAAMQSAVTTTTPISSVPEEKLKRMRRWQELARHPDVIAALQRDPYTFPTALVTTQSNSKLPHIRCGLELS